MICHYWFFNHGFKFQDFVCNGCHVLTILCLNISDTAIITVKNVDYRCIIHNISKSKAIYLLENSVLEDRRYIQKGDIQEIIIKNRVYNYHSDNLVEAEKLDTKNILIDEKNYQDLTIYFTRYVYSKSIKMLSLHYPELMGKIEEHQGLDI